LAVSCVSNFTSVSGLSSSCVLCTQCYQCLWIVFVLCLVYPMLPVSQDCLRPALGTQDTGQRQSRDTGNIGYTRHRTKTIQRHRQHWVQCLWIVFVLCLVYPMLPVSLDCLCPLSCVPNVTSVWIVFVLCLVYPMLPVSLDCLRPVSCVNSN
jgi:hypothetical protein